MIVGLTGAHRVGKTSLAKAYAEKHGFQFIETSVSAIWKELGHDPAVTPSFSDRMTIQEVILDRLETLYKGVGFKTHAITDRTPLDLIAYTMGDAVGDSVPADQQERLLKYVQRCFDVLNKHFAFCLLVPPAIPVVFEEGKAACNKAYIDHLQLIFRGLIVDDRMRTNGYRIDVTHVAMEKRIDAVQWCVDKHLSSSVEELQAQSLEGRKPH